jgi:hypothetical protein
MSNFKIRICKDCGKEYKQYNSLQKCFCKVSKPQSKQIKRPIPKVSEKRKALNVIYEKIRIEVLSEAKFVCFIDGCKNVANTVEHSAGRLGFYDDWARENNIPLLIDKRFLKACCLVHNGELETNPELSKKYQYSKISGIKKSDLL